MSRRSDGSQYTITLPGIATTSNRRSSCMRAKSSTNHRIPGALARAASIMSASRSTPTTSSPRRSSSIAIRPVPQPASRIEPPVRAAIRSALAVHIRSGRGQPRETGVVLGDVRALPPLDPSR